MRKLLAATLFVGLTTIGCGTKGALVLPPVVKEPPPRTAPAELRNDSSKASREVPTQ